MKALVTGATGFIGTALCRELVRQGHQVRALALPGEDAAALLEIGAEVRREQFSRAVYEATANLVAEAAGRVQRFLYVSSIPALGLGRHVRGLKECDPAFRSGIPYNDAELDAERLVTAFNDAGVICGTIVRPANVTGPGSVWVRDIVEKMLSMPMPLIDGGRHSASLVYVDNLVDGIIRAAVWGRLFVFDRGRVSSIKGASHPCDAALVWSDPGTAFAVMLEGTDEVSFKAAAEGTSSGPGAWPTLSPWVAPQPSRGYSSSLPEGRP